MASPVSVTLAMAMIGDGYRYVGDLGSGGGGTVVLAEHLAMNRLVAVKALVTASASALGRLRREGRVLAALDHPSILRVLRMVDDGSVVALVTEYLDGGDFEDALAEDRLPGRAVIKVLTRVGEALQAAHGASVVHRDVKPYQCLAGPRRPGRAGRLRPDQTRRRVPDPVGGDHRDADVHGARADHRSRRGSTHAGRVFVWRTDLPGVDRPATLCGNGSEDSSPTCT